MITRKFDEYCNPKRNETFERHKFFTRVQHAGETIDQFANVLKTLAKTCNFGTINDSLIRDRFICGISDDGLRERLLRREDLTLDKALTMGRITEETNTGIKTLKTENMLEINYSSTRATPSRPPSSNDHTVKRKSSPAAGQTIKNCFFCRGDHLRRKCPAYGATCQKCKRKNHYQNSEACRRSTYDVNAVSVDNCDDIFFIGHVAHQKQENWTVNLTFNDICIQFFLDSGAQGNILSFEQFKRLNPQPELAKTNVQLVSYNGNIDTIGYFVYNVCFKGNFFILNLMC